MYGKVTIQSSISDDTLIIPEEAVIFSGDHRVAFLALPRGKFAPVEVTLGPSDGNGNVQVLSGLTEGQQIVSSAQFLIDAESKMQEAINKMLSGQTSSSDMQEASPSGPIEEQPAPSPANDMPGMDMPDQASNDTTQTAAPAPTCTHDPEHAAISQDQPAQEWPNLAPDDPNAKWQCPMPNDRYFAAEPGRCPICGMALIPHDPTA
jgi:hypothetical protein